MPLLPIESLLLLCLVALFTGFIKAGMPSLGTLLTASVALMFPPRDALGITLMYLLVGDMVAVTLYWRLAHWQELKKMMLPVLAGVILGGILLAFLNNENLGLTLGVVVLVLVSLEPLRPRLTQWALEHPWQCQIRFRLACRYCYHHWQCCRPDIVAVLSIAETGQESFRGDRLNIFSVR